MKTPVVHSYVLPRFLRSFERFWFTPRDPSLLALIRIGCGMIALYTLFVYSFTLQAFMGEHAWHDLKLRMEVVRDRPLHLGAPDWNEAGRLPDPVSDFQKEYVRLYREEWASLPPPPYPIEGDWDQAKYLSNFRYEFGIDLRVNGLKPSNNSEHRLYAARYTERWGGPPPAYVENQAEEDSINKYMEEWNGIDPRRVYAKGTPIFSLWFHVTDPTSMAILHTLFVVSAFFLTIGLCTRFASALTWFGSLCYIHRNPNILFGVDTMIIIVLFYLLIGPSGSAYSLDRLIRQWWVKAKPGVVQWCYGLFKRPAPANLAPAYPVSGFPEPSISANVAIRLLQIHLCIIYMMSGLSKLQGNSWWTGSAIWLVMGNYEFAPMQYEIYLKFLRFLGSNQLLYDGFMSGGGFFTLAFEIGYAPFIWRRKLRWVFLASAIMLHGGIAIVMGLKTFSLMMLVMNMVFLRIEEVHWVFKKVGLMQGDAATTPAPALSANKPAGMAESAPRSSGA